MIQERDTRGRCQRQVFFYSWSFSLIFEMDEAINFKFVTQIDHGMSYLHVTILDIVT